MSRTLSLATLSMLTLSLGLLTGCNSGSGNQDTEGSTGGTGEPCVDGNDNHITPEGLCDCNEGFEWCSSDETDLSCCAIGGESASTGESETSAGDGDSAETTGGGDGDGDGSSGDGDGDGSSGDGDGDGSSGDGDGSSGDGDGDGSSGDGDGDGSSGDGDGSP
jgi:hypothetical protein